MTILFVLISITAISAEDSSNLTDTSNVSDNSENTFNNEVINNTENSITTNSQNSTQTSNDLSNDESEDDIESSEKIDPDIRLNNDPLEPGKNTTFIALLPEDATGQVIFKINDVTVSEKINASRTVIYTYEVPTTFRNPTYTLTLVYSGDSTYNMKRVNTTLSLRADEINVNPNMTVDDTTVKYWDIVNITAHLPSDASGNVVFKLNRTTISDKIQVVNGSAVFSYNATANPGNYRLQIVYSGNYKYAGNMTRCDLIITKLNSTATTTDITSKAGSNTTFTTRFVDELGNPVNNTYVVYKLNQVTIGNATTDENGYATYSYILPSVFNARNYTINVISRETKTIAGARVNATLTLTQLSTKVEVPTVIAKINDTVTVGATIIDENGNNVLQGRVLFYQNNKYLASVNVSLGHALYSFKPSTNVATTYNISANYIGYWKYANCTGNGILNITKIGTYTTARYVDAKSGMNVVLSASVKDKNQLNVNGGQVRFTINGTEVGRADVIDGAANLTYNIGIRSEGIYRLNATYLGSDSYYSSHNLNYVNVSTLDTRIVGSPIYVTIGQKANITVTVLDEANHHAENGTITFKLNGTVIGTAQVHNGTASIIYTPPNKYNGLTLRYIATLEANQYYSSAYTTNNITISSLHDVYVSPNGNDNNIGSSSKPFKTITYAVGHVSTFGTVHISAGTYSEYNIMLNNSIKIIGSSINNVIINGNNKGKPIFTLTEENTFITLSYMTITNGSSSANRSAGAIVSHGKLNISNVIFKNNKGYGNYSAGAIYSVGLLNLTNTYFTNNLAKSINAEGGALRLINNTTNINSVTFSGNKVNGTNNTGGAAIYLQDGDLVINNASFTSNKAYGQYVLGGAIKAAYGDIVITKSSFQKNIVNATGYGIGGAINSLSAGLYINDTTLAENKAYGSTVAGAGAIYIQYAAADIQNSVFTSNYARAQSVIGGAIEGYEAYIDFNKDTFKNNKAYASKTNAFGGVIYHEIGNLTFNGCKFINNSLSSANISIGGAMYVNANTTIVKSEFITNNVTGKNIGGGAIANMGKMNVTRTNFINNNATTYGDAITSLSSANNTIENNYWGSDNPVWTQLLNGISSNPKTYSKTQFSY
ncbi:beta strand repeat-containing protein [Methanosphaera sp.]